MRSAAAAAALGAALALAPAASAATVDVGKTCYAEGNRIRLEATGFTPSGGVDLTLERADGEVLERSREAQAEPDGRVLGWYGLAGETGWFRATQTRFRMTLRLVDRTDTSIVARTDFVFSRWNVGVSGGRIRPNRPTRVVAVGYTAAIGRPLYAHYVRRGRRVHTLRLGVLRGRCGDLRVRLARGFPFRPVARGRWRVIFNTSPVDLTVDDSIVHRVRVR